MRRMIRRRTLRDVLCDNTDIDTLQRSVLKRTERNNPEIRCSRVNEIDFDVVLDNLAMDSITEEEEEEVFILN